MSACLIALDQGTTSSRAIVFDREGGILGKAQVAFAQHYPQPGWVEHDPMEILSTQFSALKDAVAAAGVAPGEIAGIGITNQRETVIVWERDTGRPIHNAIVWQCRRTADMVERMVADGLAETVHTRCGLMPDAYFSGTKIRWILDHVPGAQARAERGELLCGTVDCWLIWSLTRGAVHCTDYSNASRTMLFDIGRLAWDPDLLAYFRIPEGMLPRPVPSSGSIGRVASGIPGLGSLAGIPICGCAGDQAAALFGQGCFERGDVKNTYGTGAFMLMNVGDRPVLSGKGLVTSVCWGIGDRVSYAMEGSVFNSGTTIQWLRDELGLIPTAHDCDLLAESVPDAGGVYLVPAFTGLGAPYWDMFARGTVTGITRGTSKAHIARAAIESIAFQVAELYGAMRDGLGEDAPLLRVDGGGAVSDVTLSIQADLCGIPIDRPACVETTAMGVAALAGLAAGVYADLSEVKALRKTDRRFLPGIDRAEAERRISGWRRAVERSLGWAKE